MVRIIALSNMGNNGLSFFLRKIPKMLRKGCVMMDIIAQPFGSLIIIIHLRDR